MYAPDLGRNLAYSDLQPSPTIRTSRDGQIIERMDISGAIFISHDNVIIRGSRITTPTGHYSISYTYGSGASGANIEYVEIDGANNAEAYGVFLNNFSLHRANIYHNQVGVGFGTNSTITESYIHDQATQPGSHNTAMSTVGGSNAVIRANNLVGSTSAAFSLYPNNSPITNILVERNLFNGGSYCTYPGGGDAKPYSHQDRDIRYIDNLFGQLLHPRCGQYGPAAAFNSGNPGNVWSGNRWQDSGELIGS